MIFLDTNHALEVGRNLTREQMQRNRLARLKLLKIAQLFINEGQPNWAIQTMCQAQFQREAIEAYERKI